MKMNNNIKTLQYLLLSYYYIFHRVFNYIIIDKHKSQVRKQTPNFKILNSSTKKTLTIFFMEVCVFFATKFGEYYFILDIIFIFSSAQYKSS